MIQQFLISAGTHHNKQPSSKMARLNTRMLRSFQHQWGGSSVKGGGDFATAPQSIPCKRRPSSVIRRGSSLSCIYFSAPVVVLEPQRRAEISLRDALLEPLPLGTHNYGSHCKTTTLDTHSLSPENVLPNPQLDCSLKAIFSLRSERCYARITLSKFLRTTKHCLVPLAFRIRTIT